MNGFPFKTDIKLNVMESYWNETNKLIKVLLPFQYMYWKVLQLLKVYQYIYISIAFINIGKASLLKWNNLKISSEITNENINYLVKQIPHTCMLNCTKINTFKKGCKLFDTYSKSEHKSNFHLIREYD